MSSAAKKIRASGAGGIPAIQRSISDTGTESFAERAATPPKV